MRPHPKAKGNPYQRKLFLRRVLEEGWSVTEASELAGWSERTGFKWLRRYREEGETGLLDRRSGPRRVRNRTSQHRVERVLKLRRQKRTAWEIAQRVRMPWSTVSGILKREGLGKLKLLEPKRPPRRYERAVDGELVHFDVKPLGRWRHGPGHRATGNRASRDRGAGWEYAHVAVDDASRLAYVEVLPDQKSLTAVGFLERALRFFQRHGLRIIREILTDNGSCYVSRRFRQACKRHRLRHIRTKPYRPQTNGKAERFIQTMLMGWAYKRAYRTSNQRRKALPAWLRYYNRERPHRALGMISPITKIRRAA